MESKLLLLSFYFWIYYILFMKIRALIVRGSNLFDSPNDIDLIKSLKLIELNYQISHVVTVYVETLKTNTGKCSIYGKVHGKRTSTE